MPAVGCQLDRDRAPVGRIRVPLDESELDQGVDRPTRGGGARAHPLRKVVQPQRSAVDELEEREALRRRHRRPVVRAAADPAQLPYQATGGSAALKRLPSPTTG
jgi:hypothetical protein